MNAILTVGQFPQDYWIWHFDKAGAPQVVPLGVHDESQGADQVAYSKNINLERFNFIFSRDEMADFCERFESLAEGLMDHETIAVMKDGELQKMLQPDILSAVESTDKNRALASTKQMLSTCVGLMKSELAGGNDDQLPGYFMPGPGA